MIIILNKYVSEDNQTNDMCKVALKQDIRFYKYVCIKLDEDILLCLIKRDSSLISNCPYKYDEQFCIKAYSLNPDITRYFHL